MNPSRDSTMKIDVKTLFEYINLNRKIYTISIVTSHFPMKTELFPEQPYNM